MERAHELVIDRNHATGIVELSTVVGGREQSYESPTSKELCHDLEYMQGKGRKEFQLINEINRRG